MANNSHRPKLSVAEFRERGYLQELNRQFLHPLGLALEVVRHPDGTESFGQVWDYRHDPEGMVYAEGVIDVEKAERIQEEWDEKREVRVHRFGHHVQPIPEK